MFIIVVIGLSVLIALARGGRLANLAHVRVRFIWLLFLPFVLQLIAFSPIETLLPLGETAALILYAISMGLAILALTLNRHLPGVIWIAVGLLLNMLVIGLNGGFMPVSASAREIAGMPALMERHNNVVPMTDTTILPWLGDILPLPAFVPLANVYSLGDVLIAIGGIIFTQRVLIEPHSETKGQTE